MIYPYSQEDIPPARPSQNYKHSGYSHNKGQSSYSRHHTKYTTPTPNVEIHPSQAYELVPVQDQPSSYQTKQPEDSKVKYGNTKSAESLATPYSVNESPEAENVHNAPQSTLYTTYNGGQLSELSGQFPSVMPSYLVDSSQLLRNAQYKSAGFTSDHLRSHGSQQVVPVLVLRIPSSYLRNPSAELYANLPHNYQLSQYLNNVNLQELVNQYFKKIGFPYAPQLMAYQSPIPVPATNYQAQQYAVSHVKPSYTHMDYSGVQYSAVQPVMAKYPLPSGQAYSDQSYYVPQTHMYQQVLQQPQYQYRYVQPTQQYYYPQYQTQDEQQIAPHQDPAQETASVYGAPQVEPQYEAPRSYAYPQQSIQHSENEATEDTSASAQYDHTKDTYAHYNAQNGPSAQYGPTKVPIPVYETPEVAAAYEPSKPTYGPPKPVSSTYELPKSVPVSYSSPKKLVTTYGPAKPVENEDVQNALPAEYGTPEQTYRVSNQDYVFNTPNGAYTLAHSGSTYAQSSAESRDYGVPKSAVQYVSNSQPTQKETIAIFPSKTGQTAYKYVYPQRETTHSYAYQKFASPEVQAKTITISENYPSKAHTHALAYGVKTSSKNPATVQSVNYVTPQPFSAKFQQQYKVMVPQTILKNEENEKVTYVNSHSLPSNYVHVGPAPDNDNPEEEYKVPADYVPPVGSQKPPANPRNYHSHPKRMTKNENKQETSTEGKKNKETKTTEDKKST